jgi:hypothetical protein
MSTDITYWSITEEKPMKNHHESAYSPEYGNLSERQLAAISSLLEKYDGKIFRVLVYSYKELTCSFTYQYKPLDLHFEKVDTTKPQVIYSCSGPAAREYYPV